MSDTPSQFPCPVCAHPVYPENIACQACGSPLADSAAEAPPPAVPLPFTRRTLLVVIVVLAAASLAYRILVAQRLEQSALLFVGIPAFIASLVAMAAPRSNTGIILYSLSGHALTNGPLRHHPRAGSLRPGPSAPSRGQAAPS